VINDGTVEFGSASDTNVTFSNGSNGTLSLDDSQHFTGVVSGFGDQDQIDFGDIGFSTNTTLGYAANSTNTGGTLTVSDGTHTASIALLGQYVVGNFTIASDPHGGTPVTDPSVAPPTDQNPITVVTHHA
jgi:hypothetical protein